MSQALQLSLLYRFIESLGRRFIAYIRHVGELQLLARDILIVASRAPFRRKLIFQQMEFIGQQSLGIVVICAFFIGSALSLQLGTIFVIFGAEGMLGGANGKALARELSPLITGFLLAGRVGASIAAELATMRVNEQIDAMEAMGVDPVSYLVVPRFFASVLMLPVLVVIFNVVGQLSSFMIATIVFDIDQAVFYTRMLSIMSFEDVMEGIEKALVFGAVIAWLSCYFGLSASGGAKGVGRATTNCVVTILLVLLLIDFVITYLQIVVS